MNIALSPDEMIEFQRRLWNWSSKQDPMLIFNGNDYQQSFLGKEWEFMVCAGAKNQWEGHAGHAFSLLKKSRKNKWICGYFGYDLKNELEKLDSSNPDELKFPEFFFFEPNHRISISKNEIKIISEQPDLFEEIMSIEMGEERPLIEVSDFRLRFSHENYIHAVQRVLQHIKDGDVYELNICIEFFSQPANMNPLWVWNALNQINPTPFASYLQKGELYILSQSPERFIKIEKEEVIAQPMKGTIKRGSDAMEDEDLKEQLRNNQKEQSENVMIVDLMRNDLAKYAKPGTVKVDELFGIYTFPAVHQMVSTVRAELNKDTDPLDVITAAFPMGSMTGCPKIRAMELIEQYEETKRGVYSGALGYITPEGDADFSVLIRTLLYNAQNKYLSLQAGSAITWESNPEKEYEECLLKASSVVDALNKIKG